MEKVNNAKILLQLADEVNLSTGHLDLLTDYTRNLIKNMRAELSDTDDLEYGAGCVLNMLDNLEGTLYFATDEIHSIQEKVNEMQEQSRKVVE